MIPKRILPPLLILMLLGCLYCFNQVKDEKPWLSQRVRSSIKMEPCVSVNQDDVKSSNPTVEVQSVETLLAVITTNREARTPEVDFPTKLQQKDTLTSRLPVLDKETIHTDVVHPYDLLSCALVVALQYYRREFGAFPKEDNRSVFSALRGKNPKGVILIEPKRQMMKNDEFVDPWGTPLLFNFESNSIAIRSAGTNLTFGDEDDIVRINR